MNKHTTAITILGFGVFFYYFVTLFIINGINNRIEKQEQEIHKLWEESLSIRENQADQLKEIKRLQQILKDGTANRPDSMHNDSIICFRLYNR